MLREALEVVVGELGKTLKTSGGGESPARSALSLVLDISDGTLGDPVNITNLEVIDGLDVVGGLNNGSEVGLGELLSGEGGELVKTHIIGPELIGVVGVDLGKVLNEDSLSVGVLKLRGILDAVLALPRLELRDGGGLLHVQENGGGADDSDEDCKLLSVHLIYYESRNSPPLLISPGRIFN